MLFWLKEKRNKNLGDRVLRTLKEQQNLRYHFYFQELQNLIHDKASC